MMSERRSVNKKSREVRLTVGVGVGTPAAAVLAWWLSLEGIDMPPGVEAAFGALIGALVICIGDTFHVITNLLLALFNKRGKS